MPVQLILLHLKRYQVLLLFWLLLFATVNGSFMHRYGAQILFLYPEYLGEVNALSASLVGAAFGIFVMCWNITTFILHSRHFRFLAATTQPFLKYCLNNAVIPLAFLLFYLWRMARFARMQELQDVGDILWIMGGFLAGFAIVIALSFSYFFGADRTIYRFMSPTTRAQLEIDKLWMADPRRQRLRNEARIDWYFGASFRLRQPRHVDHYTRQFIERIFSQHHLAAVFSVLLVFVFLIVLGYLQDNPFFQLPAASSITVFFAVLIAIDGAVTHFLRQWALPFLAAVILGLNWLYQENILDPRNKAFGLDYGHPKDAPDYNAATLASLANPRDVQQDSLAFAGMLHRWKQRQGEEQPVLVLVSVSGGGSRAATFSMNVLRTLDSLSQGGLMPKTFLMCGASGGMLGAAWFRELHLRHQRGQLNNPHSAQYVDDIALDLLNPVFSSFISRDLLAPAQYFPVGSLKYVKDRGYAFEESLNQNTRGWLNRTLADYAAVEDSAGVPRLFLSATISRDGRQLLMSTHPARFMMRPMPQASGSPAIYPDAIDYLSYFSHLQPQRLRMLSALRMNASFPYILPNVWLPTRPVIDVMDAGFRDNTGLETSLRFVRYFKDWIMAHCSRVVVLQIRDQPEGGWENPYESESIMDLVTRPALLTQNNLFRFQEFAQLRQCAILGEMLGPKFRRIVFQYQPSSQVAAASMSFHLTQREKKDILQSLQAPSNAKALNEALALIAR
jgi:hypothetical protein